MNGNRVGPPPGAPNPDESFLLSSEAEQLASTTPSQPFSVDNQRKKDEDDEDKEAAKKADIKAKQQQAAATQASTLAAQQKTVVPTPKQGAAPPPTKGAPPPAVPGRPVPLKPTTPTTPVTSPFALVGKHGKPASETPKMPGKPLLETPVAGKTPLKPQQPSILQPHVAKPKEALLAPLTTKAPPPPPKSAKELEKPKEEMGKPQAQTASTSQTTQPSKAAAPKADVKPEESEAKEGKEFKDAMAKVSGREEGEGGQQSTGQGPTGQGMTLASGAPSSITTPAGQAATGAAASAPVQSIASHNDFINLVASIATNPNQTAVTLKDGTLINVEKTGVGLNIAVSTGDSRIQGVIMDNKGNITKSLAAKNINVASLEVSLTAGKGGPVEEADEL